MAPSTSRLRPKKKKNGDVYPVAHIVTPAHRLAEAKRGQKVEALCGATVTGDPDPNAGICTACSIEQFKKDDTVSDERAQQRYDAGVERGKTDGIREGRAERDRLDREAAALALEEARKPRFEDRGKTMKFTFNDGSTATMRKNRIASVRLASTNGSHSVLVEGIPLIEHEDATLVQSHYTQVHEAVFGADN